MRNWIGIPLLVATVVVAFLPTQTVVDGPMTNQLLWNNDEAYLFMSGSRLGWRRPYAIQLLSRFSAFGASATDKRETTTVFRVTSLGVDRFELDEVVPTLFISDQHVQTGERQWRDGRFVSHMPHTVPEAFLRPGATPTGDGYRPEDIYPLPQFTNIDGWSKRTFTVPYRPQEHAISFSLDGREARLLIGVDANMRIIDLERPGVAKVRLLAIGSQSRQPSRAEYDQMFGR